MSPLKAGGESYGARAVLPGGGPGSGAVAHPAAESTSATRTGAVLAALAGRALIPGWPRARARCPPKSVISASGLSASRRSGLVIPVATATARTPRLRPQATSWTESPTITTDLPAKERPVC